MTEAELVALPKDPSLKKTVQRARTTDGGTGVNKASAAEIVWSPEFTTTNNGERFLVLDSRDLDPQAPVFVVYASACGIELLRNNNRWSIDGTFYCCPPSFKQVFTINVFIDDSSLAAAFFLLPGKSAEIYARAVNGFFDLPELQAVVPSAIMAGTLSNLWLFLKKIILRFSLPHLKGGGAECFDLRIFLAQNIELDEHIPKVQKLLKSVKYSRRYNLSKLLPTR